MVFHHKLWNELIGRSFSNKKSVSKGLKPLIKMRKSLKQVGLSEGPKLGEVIGKSIDERDLSLLIPT
jgi:hypothetical protein